MPYHFSNGFDYYYNTSLVSLQDYVLLWAYSTDDLTEGQMSFIARLREKEKLVDSSVIGYMKLEDGWGLINGRIVQSEDIVPE